IAMHHFHASNNFFVPSSVTAGVKAMNVNVDTNGNPSAVPASGKTDTRIVKHSWGAYLLPHLEQSAIFNAYNIARDWRDKPNSTAVVTVINSLVCPSAPPASGRIDSV